MIRKKEFVYVNLFGRGIIVKKKNVTVLVKETRIMEHVDVLVVLQVMIVKMNLKKNNVLEMV